MQKSVLPSKHITRLLIAASFALLAAKGLWGFAAEVGNDSTRERRLKIVCIGGHPDDPESGCAGTLARYAALGHQVTVIYLTRGERGIRGKSIEEAAQIRT